MRPASPRTPANNTQRVQLPRQCAQGRRLSRSQWPSLKTAVKMQMGGQTRASRPHISESQRHPVRGFCSITNSPLLFLRARETALSNSSPDKLAFLFSPQKPTSGLKSKAQVLFKGLNEG